MKIDRGTRCVWGKETVELNMLARPIIPADRTIALFSAASRSSMDFVDPLETQSLVLILGRDVGRQLRLLSTILGCHFFVSTKLEILFTQDNTERVTSIWAICTKLTQVTCNR